MGHESKEWRCFHCDEVFTDERSAREHFGDDNVYSCDTAACVDPLRTDEKERLKQLHKAWDCAVKLLRESEEVEDDLRRLFGDDVSSPYQAWLKLQQWQTLDDANRQRIALLERLVGEAHALLAQMGAEAEAKPTHWMLEAEQYSAAYKGNHLVTT